jgi:hypothetical protein
MVVLACGSNNTKKRLSLLHWFCSKPPTMYSTVTVLYMYCRIMQKDVLTVGRQTWFHHCRTSFLVYVLVKAEGTVHV